MGIYKIANILNNKVYIGSSNNIYSRFKDHKTLLRNNKHHSNHLQNAWNKYGEENFEFNIVEEIEDKQLLRKKELEYSLKYSSLNPKYGYNIAPILEQNTYILNNKDSYVFTWRDIVAYKNIRMDNKLNIFEKAFLYTIAPLIDPSSNAIIYKKEYPISDTLAQLSSMSCRKIYQVIQSLENKGLVKRVKKGFSNILYVNPHYLRIRHLTNMEKEDMFNVVKDVVGEMF